jgi:hypothetical protein
MCSAVSIGQAAAIGEASRLPTTTKLARGAWLSTVFMPLNRQMRDVIVTHADLLEEGDVDPCLLDLCAHVAAYEAILKRWESHDYAEHAAPLVFPRHELSEYASDSFRRLKSRQKAFLQDQS